MIFGNKDRRKHIGKAVRNIFPLKNLWPHGYFNQLYTRVILVLPSLTFQMYATPNSYLDYVSDFRMDNNAVTNKLPIYVKYSSTLGVHE